MSERVTLVEVGPRDGLQNEKGVVRTAEKIRMVDLLTRAGLSRIEVTAFVNPARVPQMADGAAVMAGITRAPTATYSALVPNMRGLDAALAAGASEVAVFAAASEGFSQANINCSIRESFDRFRPVIAAAQDAGIPVRGYLSCVIACPYEGPIAPRLVAQYAADLAALGCHEISLGDTIGAGTPATIAALLEATLRHLPPSQLAGHFHDTGGAALDNIVTSLDHGLRVFDTAIAGLGGCPFAPGAPGNVATEAVAALLATKGYETDLDAGALARAADFAREVARP